VFALKNLGKAAFPFSAYLSPAITWVIKNHQPSCMACGHLKLMYIAGHSNGKLINNLIEKVSLFLEHGM